LNLTPIPDPDAEGEPGQNAEAPSLFDPRERTASRAVSPAWSFSPIVWPEKPADEKSIPRKAVAMPSGDEPDEPESDSSGWRAVRP
jgi:hypothetical protein